jgi:hypothetical protein
MEGDVELVNAGRGEPGGKLVLVKTRHVRGSKLRQLQPADGQMPVVVCSQLPDNGNTSVTNMAEYLAAEVIEGYNFPRRWSG